MYSIIDIETTGGKYNEEGITEIAIYRFDGHEIVDQFISLVNPERPIQPFVVNLTGINNDMLRNAPKFYEIAKRIVEITTDTIVVAHNAQFDYRILSTEFSRLGFEFERKTLCTVDLSQTLIPDQKSYSLGKLVRSLGIPIPGRHRADGDALATLKLFKLLLSKDLKKTIISDAVRTETKKHVASKLLRIIEEVPSVTGVYYIHNDDGKIIYIGKSKNIKKRLTQHFISGNERSKKLRNEVASASYEHTGSELLALLKENEEIKLNKPKFNRSYRKPLFGYALYVTKEESGYTSLKIAKADGRKKSLITFTNLQQARHFIIRIIEEYSLCQKLIVGPNGQENCSHGIKRKCNGACIGKELPEVYNQRVQQLIERYTFEEKNIAIIDRGREVGEQSVVLIENGAFKGFGFFNLNHQLQQIAILRSIITPMTHTKDAQHIIQSYLRKNKRLKVIEIDINE